MTQRDTVEPKEDWEFDRDVARSFDDMLSRSIPQYTTMRRAVFDFQRGLLPRQDGRLLDLGASRGESAAKAINHFGDRADFYLIERSDAMLEEVRNRFGDRENVYIEDRDLRNGFPSWPCNCVQSILTLQFIPVNYRQSIIQRSYDTLRDGGGMILVEKVLGQGAQIDDFMVSYYHRLKRDHEYTYEDVQKKKESLENVLIPTTARENRRMLIDAGFSHVDCFWRWMNFAGWIALK